MRAISTAYVHPPVCNTTARAVATQVVPAPGRDDDRPVAEPGALPPDPGPADVDLSHFLMCPGARRGPRRAGVDTKGIGAAGEVSIGSRILAKLAWSPLSAARSASGSIGRAQRAVLQAADYSST